MDLALGIVITAVAAISIVAVFILFVWAARKDGEDERERQRRLGP